MVFLTEKQKGKTMQQNKFEKGLIETIKMILSNPDIELKYQHNGAGDNFYIFTAISGKTEIFKLRIYKDQNLAIIPLHSELKINGEIQSLQPATYKDLYTLADNEWWSRERNKSENKKQAEEDTIQKQQNQTLNFLANFVPEKGML